jgi:hypothetical protein
MENFAIPAETGTRDARFSSQRGIHTAVVITDLIPTKNVQKRSNMSFVYQNLTFPHMPLLHRAKWAVESEWNLVSSSRL